jgi:hypothetical protein
MRNFLSFLLTILFITSCGSKVPIVELKDFIGKYSGEGGLTITIDTIAASDYIKYKGGPNGTLILNSFLRDGSYENNGIVYIDDPNSILSEYSPNNGKVIPLPKNQPVFGFISRKANNEYVRGVEGGLFYIPLHLSSYNAQDQKFNLRLEFRYKNWNRKRYIHVFNKQKKEYEDIELIKSN